MNIFNNFPKVLNKQLILKAFYAYSRKVSKNSFLKQGKANKRINKLLKICLQIMEKLILLGKTKKSITKKTWKYINIPFKKNFMI